MCVCGGGVCGACVNYYIQSRVFPHSPLIDYCISFSPFPSLSSSPPSYNQVFKSLSPIHCARTHTEPYCTDIIELPFSVFAMDHLSGVQDRHSYDSLEGTYREEEKELKEVRERERGECGGGIMFLCACLHLFLASCVY